MEKSTSYLHAAHLCAMICGDVGEVVVDHVLI